MRKTCVWSLWLIAVGWCNPSPAQEAKERRPLTGCALVAYSIAFSPDSKTLAATSHDNTVRLWDVATGGIYRATYEIPDFYPYKVLFAPDGRTLLVGGWPMGQPGNDEGPGIVRLCEPETGKERA